MNFLVVEEGNIGRHLYTLFVQGGSQGHESRMEKHDNTGGGSGMAAKPVEKVQVYLAVPQGKEEEGEGEGGSVLGAIKETIAEIGQTTTQFIVGQPRYDEEGDNRGKFEQEAGKKRQ